MRVGLQRRSLGAGEERVRDADYGGRGMRGRRLVGVARNSGRSVQL